MKTDIFITVRIDSSRLSNKTSKLILGIPVLEHIINRAKLAKKINDVIVCTTTRLIDDWVADIAEKKHVKVYRGSLDDKLDRWYNAAKEYNTECIVTFDGDDLFCDPYLIDLGAEQIQSADLDFIEAPEGLVCGGFTYAIKTTALEKVCEIKDSDDTEMMWTYFKDTGLFKTGELNVANRIYFNDTIRLTLDYQEDFDFFTSVFEHYNCVKNDVPLDEILSFLNKNPDIAKINYFRHKEWRENQISKTHLEIKKGTVQNESK